jgi:hypothetical protein
MALRKQSQMNLKMSAHGLNKFCILLKQIDRSALNQGLFHVSCCCTRKPSGKRPPLGLLHQGSGTVEKMHLVAQLRREAWSSARGEADLGSRYPSVMGALGCLRACLLHV